MTDIKALRALADELKGAIGPSRELDGKIHDAFYGVLTWTDACAGLPKVFSYSLDAADALRREVLPGWDVADACWHDEDAAFRLSKFYELNRKDAEGRHKLKEIAYVLAIVEAKIKEGE